MVVLTSAYPEQRRKGQLALCPALLDPFSDLFRQSAILSDNWGLFIEACGAFFIVKTFLKTFQNFFGLCDKNEPPVHY